MQQAVKKSASTLTLKDPSLLRQQCYINGKWVDADSGKSINVVNPAFASSPTSGKTWPPSGPN